MMISKGKNPKEINLRKPKEILKITKNLFIKTYNLPEQSFNTEHKMLLLVNS